MSKVAKWQAEGAEEVCQGCASTQGIAHNCQEATAGPSNLVCGKQKNKSVFGTREAYRARGEQTVSHAGGMIENSRESLWGWALSRWTESTGCAFVFSMTLVHTDGHTIWGGIFTLTVLLCFFFFYEKQRTIYSLDINI